MELAQAPLKCTTHACRAYSFRLVCRFHMNFVSLVFHNFFVCSDETIGRNEVRRKDERGYYCPGYSYVWNLLCMILRPRAKDSTSMELQLLYWN